MQLHAPFAGTLHTVQLFTLVDKVGVGAVTLSIRDLKWPHALRGREIKSKSDGISDPGMHLFSPYLNSPFPVFVKNEDFLLCIGTDNRTALASDPDNLEPFLHLPMTKIPETNIPGEGKTFLLAIHDAGNISTGAKVQPWADWSFPVRAEFVQQSTTADMALPPEEKAGSWWNRSGLLLTSALAVALIIPCMCL